MRALRNIATVRFEADIEVIIGELNNLEDEFIKLSPKDFIAAWMPEIRDTRLIIKLKEKPYEDEKHRGDKRKSNNPKQQSLPFDTQGS